MNLVQARKVAKLRATVAEGDTFRAVAEEWFAKNSGRRSSHYAIRERRNLEKDLYPFIGTRRVADVEPMVLHELAVHVKAPSVFRSSSTRPPMASKRRPATSSSLAI